MQKTSSTKGFTLVEVLVAIGLFTVVSTIAASVLVDVVQLQKKSSIQNEIYEDARILMQQLTNEIQSGTVDYEEYYSNYVIQKKKQVVSGDRYYGINYGVYSSRFFDPGRRLDKAASTNPSDLGIECSYPRLGDTAYDATKSCEIYFSDSTDLNTGQNPYKNNPGAYIDREANAFCDKIVGAPATCPNGNSPRVTFDVSPTGAYSNAHVKELYLIDSTGMHKTIVAQRNINATGNCGTSTVDCAVGMVKMTGRDLDQNGVIDVFGCDSDYKCFQQDGGKNILAAFKYTFLIGKDLSYLVNNNISLPQFTDLAEAFDATKSQFVPITPRRANVKALNFTINPVDDPYKAYAETSMQTQPTVTISMTIGLASAYKADYPGAFPDITLQTTVTAGVIGKIDAYPPVNDIMRENGKTSWIYNIFN